jgi:rSAM/selenodomain-associated transferase 1
MPAFAGGACASGRRVQDCQLVDVAQRSRMNGPDYRSQVLVVMAKVPRLGAVKTRLAAAVGAAPALALYSAFLADLGARFGGGATELVWAVDPPGGDLGPWVGAAARCLDQRGADLGERMANCCADLFAGGARRVVMIGADAPHLDDARIAAAFGSLRDHDVVLTPTRDGGYCLVGLTAPRDLFSIRMGTADVLRQTLLRADALGLRVKLQAPTFDVDEVEDAARLSRALDDGAVPPLPRTAEVLREWRRRGLLADRG